MGVVDHDRPFGANHLNPGGREIGIGWREHPACADGKHTPVIQGDDNPYAIRYIVRRLHDFANFLSVHTDRLRKAQAPSAFPETHVYRPEDFPSPSENVWSPASRR